MVSDTIRTVLLIEDSDDHAELVRRAFSRSRDTFNLLRADSCSGAWTLLETIHPTLIICDYMLPDGTGLDLYRNQLKKKYPDVPIVLLTSQGDELIAVDAMKSGVTDYIVKSETTLASLPDLCRAIIRENYQKHLNVKNIEALRESEERYRSILHASIDGFLLVDKQNQIIEGNAAYCGMSGYGEQELLAMNISDLEATMTADDFAAKSQQIEAQGADRFLTRHRRKDGSLFDVEVSVTFHAGGQEEKVIFLRDITERKKMEHDQNSNIKKLEALRQISSFPSANIKTISDQILASIISITDSEYGFYGYLSADETSMTIYSCSGDAMEVCAITDKPSEYNIATAGIWAEVVRHREPLILNNYAASHRAKKGLPFGHVQLTKLLVVPFFSEGKLSAVAGVANRSLDYSQNDVAQMTVFLTNVQTIMDRKRMERELKLGQERYRLIAESLAIIPWEFNIQDNKWTYVGPQVTQMLGYEPHEWTTFEWWLERIHPEDKAWVPEYCSAFTARGEEHSMEYRMMNKSGGIVWVNDIVAIEMEAGKPVIMRGVMIDISERKRSEEEKEKLENQLHQTQKIESIGQLAGGVAHDFNNMLSVILGHAELALMKAMPSSPSSSNLEEICKAANRSADLTRQLLTFARKQTVVPKVLDLNATVAAMLNMLQRLIGENIHLSWNPAPNLWPVKIDPSQMDQILANLCVNARDAIIGIGEISIETSERIFDQSYTESHSDILTDDYVRLSVSDNGCGMGEETLAKIFEPFFTTKEVGCGTGLGLATVFGAVKQNDGFIDVLSTPGQGTIFNIYLPRVQAEVETAEEIRSKPLRRGAETVLLVEDDKMLLQTITTMLEESGYTVLIAATPDLAQSLAREHSGKIDLLISDVIMPVMNGKELSEKIKILCPEIKILFISGYTADIISSQGIIEGGLQFLQKPISFEALTTKVREVLGSR